MTIQKPYDLSIKNQIIDANLPYTLSWRTSGDTSASFAISIYNNSTNVLVWQLPRTYSLALSYTIPANSIPNGVEYKLEVIVWNSSDQSATSQFVVFTASTTPVVTVAPITTVGNHSNLFTATYTQAESDPISTYVANLYSSDQVLLKTSGVKTGSPLEHRFDLMKNDLTYYIEFVATSKKGLSDSSGLIQFTVVYDNPSMYFTLEAENIPDKASVKLKWELVQVIGKTNITPTYISGTKLDVRTGKVFFDEGFEIINDFTLKIWFEDIEPNVDLVYLRGSNGTIRVQYESDNMFHLYKTIGQYTSHYATGEVVGNVIFLCVQSNNGKMNLVPEVIS